MAFFNSAAKKAFDAYKKENGSDKKLPRISELNAEQNNVHCICNSMCGRYIIILKRMMRKF